MKRLLFLITMLLSSGFAIGCHNNDGPLESAAKDLDEAIDELD